MKVINMIVDEILYGTKSMIYIIFESFKERKKIGPGLYDLLIVNNVEVLCTTSAEWELKIGDKIKCLNFVGNNLNTGTTNDESVKVLFVS